MRAPDAPVLRIVHVTRRAIIIHGCCEEEEFYGDGPSCSNNHWLPWLQKQLTNRGIETQTLEMPQPHRPKYAEWKRVLDRCAIDEHTVLVGHSCGAGFLVKGLCQGTPKAERLFLVAPW